MFKIDYGYGTRPDEELYQTLDAAMEEADECAAYTQQTITILELDGDSEKPAAERRWYGVAPEKDKLEEDIIAFGDFGFFDEWYIY